MRVQAQDTRAANGADLTGEIKMRAPAPTLAVVGLAFAAFAAPGAARERSVPAAIPEGPPVNCIPIRQIRQSQVRSDTVIDFMMTNRRVFRQSLPAGGCPQLGFERRFGYRTTIGRLCAGDIITVLPNPPVGGGASCALGSFRPVTLATAR